MKFLNVSKNKLIEINKNICSFKDKYMANNNIRYLLQEIAWFDILGKKRLFSAENDNLDAWDNSVEQGFV